MKISFLLVFALTSYCGVTIGAPILPDGWRLPTKAELGEEHFPGKYRTSQIIGDFNGDGIKEGAYILISKDGKYEGLFAYIYLDGKENWFELGKLNFHESIFMVLTLYVPENYDVICVTDEECNTRL